MLKPFRYILALVILGSLITPQLGFAAVKTGASCKKIGATAATNGKKFTCIKTGKKLVWNKGVAISAPKPTVTPTPVATPTPSPTPTFYVPPTPIMTPTPAPIVEKAPTGFADLVENYRGIPGVVWNEAQNLQLQDRKKLLLNLSMGLTQSYKPKLVHL